MRGKSRYIAPLRYLAESILPMLFWVSLIFGFDTPDVAVLTILCALIHEAGHVGAVVLLSGEGRLRAHISGFRILAPVGSYRDEIITLAAGPAVNVAIFIISIPFWRALGGYVRLIGIINLLTALSNLAPIEGYDGYGILYKLASRANAVWAMRALHAASFFLSVVLTLLSLYFMLRYGEGYWIFGVFFILLLGKIKKILP